MFKTTKKWITIVEIIIAIIIFWFWVLTILNMIIENLSLLDKVKNKTTATFLSKEWIEIIYNIRDWNLDRWLKWDCANINSAFDCIQRFSNLTPYKVSLNITWYYDISTTTDNPEDNMLYYHTWTITKISPIWAIILTGFWYDYDSNDWEQTIFSRYIIFSWTYLEWDGWIADINKLLKIESHVFYKKWWYTWDVVLESFIWEVR